MVPGIGTRWAPRRGESGMRISELGVASRDRRAGHLLPRHSMCRRVRRTPWRKRGRDRRQPANPRQADFQYEGEADRAPASPKAGRSFPGPDRTARPNRSDPDVPGGTLDRTGPERRARHGVVEAPLFSWKPLRQGRSTRLLRNGRTRGGPPTVKQAGPHRKYRIVRPRVTP